VNLLQARADPLKHAHCPLEARNLKRRDFTHRSKAAVSRMEQAYVNRTEAGRLLVEKLEKYANRDDVIVLGLPRGGVPVAYEVAKRLHAPLDVFIVRKLGVPGFEELAAGAIASGGVRVLNEDVVRAIPYASEAIEAVTAKETAELERREQIYREGRPPPELRDKIVLLVDDGLATGATMRAAVKALRERGAAKIVMAVPVGPPDTCEELAHEADEGICLSTPSFLQAVGQYYEDFSQTSDDDVRELLTRAAQEISGDKSGHQQ
jgi:predicted phosphoribosyltransferase